MKNFKRMLALVLTVCMVLALAPAVFAEETTGETPVLAAEDEVVVYYTNDVHTYIDGAISYDNLADLKAQTAEQAAGVLLVDAGDHIQGTAYGSMDKGATIIELMNATGYDLATLGNHEFDYGMEGALATIDAANFPYVSANFYHEYQNPFTDLEEGAWYVDYVLNMAQRGIIKGVTDTTFVPDGDLTRAQFVTMLYRIAGEPDVTGLDNPFTDLVPGSFYEDAAIYCAALGVVKGVTPTTFGPESDLTREMMVTMLWRAVGEPSPETDADLSGYTDAGIVAEYAQAAMNWAVAEGVVNGTSNTTLSPRGTCTRAMAAKVLDLLFFLGLPIYDTVVAPYEVFEIGGMTVAFVGITTPETFTKSTPAYFQDENGNYIYGIAGGADGSDLYMSVQLAVLDAMLTYEPDYIIGLAHLGDDPASQPWTSEELIANTVGLDAVIDGHSHSTVEMKEVENALGETVVLTQTGEYFGAIGRMSITESGIETSLITEWTGSDESVAQIKNDWIAAIDEQLGEVIGYAEVTFDNYDAEGNRLVRKMETNTGDFAADALYYLFDNMDLDVDVAIMNGGGVRNKAITGELSYKTCKDIHTFGNVACLQTITGQQLLDALEWGARGTTTEEIGGFLHVSGITYEIDTTIASTVQMDDKGVWIGGPTGEYRVKNVKILQDGEYVDLDLDASYNLAGYNYTLRDLGDGFAMFDGAVNVVDYVMEDYMVLANYVKSFPVNEETGLPTITAENSPYGDVYGEGRITIK